MDNNELVAQCVCGDTDSDYNTMLESMQHQFAENISKYKYVFHTNTSKLFDIFLSELPEDQRQHYNCNTCHHFIHRFGNLVFIDEHFQIHSAIWRNVDVIESHRMAFVKMAEMVERSKINSLLVSDRSMLGTATTGDWNHLSVTLPNEYLNPRILLTDVQVAAEKLEDYRALQRALNKFSRKVADSAITILKSNPQYHAESALTIAEWFRNMHIYIEKSPKLRSNIVWLMVAAAPAGWCHISSTKIGSLMDDLNSNLSYGEIIRRFETVMDPLKNQRPQKAPSDGNIDQAETIIKKLGIKPSFRRRYATIDDIQKYWEPTQIDITPSDDDSLFQHLRNNKAESVDISDSLPPIPITWEKFNREILPNALDIECLIPYQADKYVTFVTASDPTAPPILQWDTEDCRNPVSWFIRTKTEYLNAVGPATDARSLNIPAGTYHRISAISFMPYMWNDRHLSNFKPGIVLILDKAHDRGCCDTLGLALFPSILRSELHGIRATIEAFSNAGKLEGDFSNSVCGLQLEKGGIWSTVLKVKMADSTLKFKLDRWE